MNLLNKLERKFGRYAIPNLMKYIVMLYGVGLIIGTIQPMIFNQFLSLNFDMIRRGQIWRLVTFIIPQVSVGSLIYVVIEAYMFYMIGTALERTWGAFRLNMYFFSGVIFNVIAAWITYLITGFSVNPSLEYVYGSMFFAFAAIYPNTQFLIFFLIPVKVKYLALISGGLYVFIVIQNIAYGNFLGTITIIVSMANFLIFFFANKNYKRFSPREFERKAKFRQQMRKGMNAGHHTSVHGHSVVARHKCFVCGKTEHDDEDLEFRFCSRCDGNYEYCMEHLFTHEHVKNNIEI